MSDNQKKPICIPAGGPIDRLLPDYLKNAPKVDLVQCPYNPCHLVKPSKLRGHIIKCERTHPKLSICYYNATHRMPAEELPEHLRKCPSRMDVAPYTPVETSQFFVPTPNSSTLTPLKPVMTVPKKPSSQFPPGDNEEDDNWDI